MIVCRFDSDRLGLVEGDTVRDVTPALDCLPRHAYPLPRFDPLIANLAAIRRQIESLSGNAPRRPLAGVKLLSPIANPGKILAAPVNYRKHLEEVREDPAIHHQKANTHDLILGIAELIEFATSFYTVHPGDVLLTGTPEGVGPVKPGDRLVAEIQGIGRMEVAVRAA